ncbi:MAG: TIGR03000 domain-containing protein [Planctomycetes bacterium]|nr:TIGR03000 domain-containing protein [Planctomycetota bacterium]
MRWFKNSVVALLLAAGWLSLSPQSANAQVLVYTWGWRNLVAPQLGGPWIAPDVRFRPLGILDGDPVWRRGVSYTPAYNQGMVIVNVPDDNASVWIQGKLSQTTGKQRVFVTPPLQPGVNYSYEIRVRQGDWINSTDETRTVPIRLGEQVFVDFSRPAVETLPPPTRQ